MLHEPRADDLNDDALHHGAQAHHGEPGRVKGDVYPAPDEESSHEHEDQDHEGEVQEGEPAALGLPALWERLRRRRGDHQEPEQEVPRPAHRGGARRARRRAGARRGAVVPDAHQRARDAGARSRDDAH